MAKGRCVNSKKGENNSGYHSNSRFSFLFVSTISSDIRFSLYWALFIYLYNVATFYNSRSPLYWVLDLLHHIPILCHKFQYKVTIFCNSRLPLNWDLIGLSQNCKLFRKLVIGSRSRSTLYDGHCPKQGIP